MSADRRPLVRRAGEVGEIVGLAHQAAGGRAGALLVSDEAGVGKTALLREACSQVSEVADVLWAACLPLTSLAVPFLPLKSALREWSHALEPRVDPRQSRIDDIVDSLTTTIVPGILPRRTGGRCAAPRPPNVLVAPPKCCACCVGRCSCGERYPMRA